MEFLDLHRLCDTGNPRAGINLRFDDRAKKEVLFNTDARLVG